MDDLIAGRVHDPHAVLGAHPDGGHTVIRTLRRGAGAATVLFGDERHPMSRVRDEGVFEVEVPGSVLDYRVEVDGAERDDPYRYLPSLGEMDLHLIREGRHERLWTVLGAHVREYDGPMGAVRGTSFAVWAPHARAVHVIGDFNGWDAIRHPMRLLGESGVWELFIPGVGVAN